MQPMALSLQTLSGSCASIEFRPVARTTGFAVRVFSLANVLTVT